MLEEVRNRGLVRARSTKWRSKERLEDHDWIESKRLQLDASTSAHPAATVSYPLPV